MAARARPSESEAQRKQFAHLGGRGVCWRPTPEFRNGLPSAIVIMLICSANAPITGNGSAANDTAGIITNKDDPGGPQGLGVLHHQPARA